MRVFVGIDLPPEIKRSCQQVSDQLRRLGLEARFVPAESLHLTLKFLGEIEDDVVPSIGGVLQQVGNVISPFSIEVGGLSAFPSGRRPRLVWLGVERGEPLGLLWKQVEDGLEGLGFSREEREYSPHLTLLRLKSTRNVAALVRYLEQEGDPFRMGRLTVSEMHLFRSILRPQGAQYRKLLTARLGGPSGRA